ncbi:MAG: 50S ribosome-binding GTPase [Candidatus Lokiarchaeota archaeon]|nr:50S ribosome-binding GTPase [Candidatus Lokiarchaeota archaeon]
MAKRKGETLLISHIISRFIKPELKYTPEQFTSIKEILELPITALKNIDKIEAAQIHDIFRVNSIEELAELNPNNPIEHLLPSIEKGIDPKRYEKKVKIIKDQVKEGIPDLEKFRNHVAVAGMIKRSWSKRKTYTKKRDTKVICVGLDNAGKTAILSGLGGKLGISELGKLKPTKRIERKRISTTNLDLFIWDFGGQEEYRKDYLAKPEAYFVGTDLLIYVLDMQDPERYNESFEYLIEILEVIRLLGENVYILAFMHKADPDILLDPDFQLNSEYVADKLNYHLSNYDFEYDIYSTSIYNFFTSEPKFSRFIKDVLSDKESLNNPLIRKVEGMGDILDSTLNAVVTLANSLGEQISALNQRINDLETKLEAGILPLPETSSSRHVRKESMEEIKVPSIIYTKPSAEESEIESSSQASDIRLTILNELSSLFQAKKNLDTNNPINKLGSLGKKMKKGRKKK